MLSRCSRTKVASEKIATHLKHFFDIWINTKGHVAVVIISEKGHHFMYNIGYCMKDRNYNHFDYVVYNIDSSMLRAGISAHHRIESKRTDGKIIMNKKDVTEHMHTFYFCYLDPLENTCPFRVLQWMLSTGEYSLADEWGINAARPLQKEQFEVHWRMALQPIKARRKELMVLMALGSYRSDQWWKFSGGGLGRRGGTYLSDHMPKQFCDYEDSSDEHVGMTLEEAKLEAKQLTLSLSVNYRARQANRRTPPPTPSDTDEEESREEAIAAGRVPLLRRPLLAGENSVRATDAGFNTYIEQFGYQRNDHARYDEEQRRQVERRERRLRRARDASNPEHGEADLVGDDNDEAGPSNAAMGAEEPEREYRELGEDNY